MDNNRLILAVALSVAILLGFELVMPKQNRQALHQQASQTTQATPPADAPKPGIDPASAGNQPVAVPAPRADARLPIQAPRVMGSIDLTGAKLDDLVLRDYHETIQASSPQVRVLEPGRDPQPNLVQLGWGAAPDSDIKLPTGQTRWSSDNKSLTAGTPVTLSWDNGAGLVFQLVFSIDSDFMFSVEQRVRNTTGKPVSLYPWSRVSRAYTPLVTGGYLVHEGPIAVIAGRLQEMSYKNVQTNSASGAGGGAGVGWSAQQPAGTQAAWAGITDKYWLGAILPPSNVAQTGSYRYVPNGGAGTYQIDFIAASPTVIAAGATVSTVSHVFARGQEGDAA